MIAVFQSHRARLTCSEFVHSRMSSGVSRPARVRLRPPKSVGLVVNFGKDQGGCCWDSGPSNERTCAPLILGSRTDRSLRRTGYRH